MAILGDIKRIMRECSQRKKNKKVNSICLNRQESKAIFRSSEQSSIQLDSALIINKDGIILIEFN